MMVLLKNECSLSDGTIIGGGDTQPMLPLKNQTFAHSGGGVQKLWAQALTLMLTPTLVPVPSYAHPLMIKGGWDTESCINAA